MQESPEERLTKSDDSDEAREKGRDRGDDCQRGWNQHKRDKREHLSA